jgi:phytol kinase
MVSQLVILLIFIVGFSLLMIFNEVVYRRLGLTGEVTRKFAHLTATLSAISFPFLFTDHWYVLTLAIIFFIVLLLSRRTQLLNSINAIERDSFGSFLLPAAIYLTFLVSHQLDDLQLYILPMLVLAISDPAAGIMGINVKRFNHRIRIFSWEPQKTWLGSLAFFVSSFIISLLVLYHTRLHFDLVTFGLAMIIALVSTIIEMISVRGTDNLFIPVGVMGVMLLLG